MTRERMSAEEYVNAAGGFAGLEKPKSKYRNTPTIVDGIRFQSKAEAKRWDELRMLEKAGEITDLKRQVAFPLYAEGNYLVGNYVADFSYRKLLAPPEPDYWQLVVEDVKGVRTALFNWKAKHFSAQMGIDITIIRGPRRSTRSKRK